MSMLPIDYEENELEEDRRSLRPWSDKQREASPPQDGASDVRSPESLALSRFLRAARRSRNLSIDTVSRKAALPKAVLIGLESGLYAPDDVQQTWLEQLAEALDEDSAMFALLLGRPLAARQPVLPPALERSRADHHTSDVFTGATVITYFATGWSGCWPASRESYRAHRPEREPEHQFFSK